MGDNRSKTDISNLNKIIKIDCNDCLYWFEFIREIKHELVKQGVILIEKVPEDRKKYFLKNLALSLGKISRGDVIIPDQEVDTFLHRVEVHKPNLKDNDNFLILSTTSLEFNCHTDGYFEPDPIDIVILQCIIPDKAGGDSIIVFLEDVISQLDVESIKALKQPIFPSRCGRIAILTEDDSGLSIRYNRLELDRGSILHNVKLSSFQVKVLDRLDAAIDSSKIYLKLMPYECLIINNKKVLHGRTVISSEDSNRLFKRVQLYF